MLKTVIMLGLFTSAVIAQTLHPQWQQYFDQLGTTGCMVIFDENAQEWHYYNQPRCEQQFLPASTFKILNSLIALQTGVIQNEQEKILWDGKQWQFVEWNKDQNLQTAIEFSVVWAYQELARRIGQERMQYWVNAAEYGNKNIGNSIDTFWLDGDIRISAVEQINFLQKLWHNELPFSAQVMETVKKITIREENENFCWRYKTGWTMRAEPQIGWLVGFLQENENVYYFALNLDIAEPEQAKGRMSITENIFKSMGLLNRP